MELSKYFQLFEYRIPPISAYKGIDQREGLVIRGYKIMATANSEQCFNARKGLLRTREFKSFVSDIVDVSTYLGTGGLLSRTASYSKAVSHVIRSIGSFFKRPMNVMVYPIRDKPGFAFVAVDGWLELVGEIYPRNFILEYRYEECVMHIEGVRQLGT